MKNNGRREFIKTTSLYGIVGSTSIWLPKTISNKSRVDQLLEAQFKTPILGGTAKELFYELWPLIINCFATSSSEGPSKNSSWSAQDQMEATKEIMLSLTEYYENLKSLDEYQDTNTRGVEGEQEDV